jgi:HK97 family phage prohead protease
LLLSSLGFREYRRMMNKVFNLESTFKAVKGDGDGLYIEGMASTRTADRVGDIIPPEAWTIGGGLDNFKSNPIILFNHNYSKPIGKATEIRVTEEGLFIKAYISKAAPDGVHELIKDGILGTFSVGFIIKDAEYIEETNGFKIKEAELLENSVVSVPMNQTATFSIAKSFDSNDEFEDFTKTFTNREDLAGQSLANGEVKASSVASNSLEGEPTGSQKEIEMSGDTYTPTKAELEAIAVKAAEDVAARNAMKQAQTQAKKDAEDNAKVELTARIEAGIKSGAEQLAADLETKMTARNADLDEIVKQFKTELEEKSAELTAMRESKQVFADRGGNVSIKAGVMANKAEFIQAGLLGVITGKGYDTDFARDVITKAGMDYATDTAATGELDLEIKDQIQKEIWVQTKVASLFREINVEGRATVLPLQSDTGYADWTINQGFDPTAHGTLENRGEAIDADVYKARSVTMLVDRMISATYIDNDVEEKTLVNLLPMLFDGVARAHARKVESALLYPSNGNLGVGDVVAHITDIEAASAISGVATGVGADIPFTAGMLMAARGEMGRYGLMPTDVAYVVSMQVYYDLISDPEFQNLNEVGDIATKLRGVVGGVFGSPVIVSEEFPADAPLAIGAYCINRNNYLIPRLRGINVESDYEVANQRKMIVASQSLGFTELFAGDAAGNEPIVSIAYGAAA